MRKYPLKQILAVILVLLLCTGCGRKVVHSFTWTDALDTVSNIQVYDKESNEDKLYSELESLLQRYHKLFNVYEDYEGINNIKTINDCAGQEPVKVDAEIIELLEMAKEMYTLTNGQVNVAMGSVLSIWHEYREAGLENPDTAKLPPMEDLQVAAEHTDINKIIIDKEAGTVYLEDANMSLDTGAIAKGFVTDKIKAYFNQQELTQGLINLGGNLMAIGPKDNNQPWRIGLQNPDLDSEESNLCVIFLRYKSMVTSGDYMRYYEVDGVKYNHLIDPDTLMSATTFASVSVICDDSVVADGLSTALFCMNLEDGMALIESLDDTEAVWISEDGTQHMSTGFAEYIGE